MTKAANAKPSNKRRAKVATKRVRKPRPLTFGEKVRRANLSWAGDDLEEVMAFVAATRLPSKF